MPIDPDTARAAYEEAKRRKRAERAEAHEQRIKEKRTSGRQARATIKRREQATINAANARTAAHVQERQAASAIKLEQSRQNRAAIAQEARAAQPTRMQRYRARGEAAAENKVISTATPSSDSGLVMTTIFIMAGLIVMYMLVTNPSATTGWLGTLGNGLHKLSSNTPLFTSTSKG